MKTKYRFKNATSELAFSDIMPVNKVISDNIHKNGGYFTLDDEYQEADNGHWVINFENINADDFDCSIYDMLSDMVIFDSELNEFFEEITDNELHFYIEQYERKIVNISYYVLKKSIESSLSSSNYFNYVDYDPTHALCTLVFEEDGQIFANVVWRGNYAIVPAVLLVLSRPQQICEV